MPFYQTFTTTRTTPPDLAALTVQLKAIDPNGVIYETGPRTYVAKKATAWTAPQIANAQTALDTVATLTPQRAAQNAIDQLSVVDKAIILTILDQFNVVRSKLAPPLPAITVADMIAAVRTKAGTL